MGEGIVHFAMERAEFFAVEIERAGLDATDGVDGVDDLENVDGVWSAGEGVAPILAALGGNEAGAGEGLKNFDEVVRRDLGTGGDALGGDGELGTGGEDDHRAESVFHSLREHETNIRYVDTNVHNIMMNPLLRPWRKGET